MEVTGSQNQQTKSPWISAKLSDEVVGDHHHACSGRNGVLKGGCLLNGGCFGYQFIGLKGQSGRKAWILDCVGFYPRLVNGFQEKGMA